MNPLDLNENRTDLFNNLQKGDEKLGFSAIGSNLG